MTVDQTVWKSLTSTQGSVSLHFLFNIRPEFQRDYSKPLNLESLMLYSLVSWWCVLGSHPGALMAVFVYREGSVANIP